MAFFDQNRYSFWYYRKGSQKDRDPSEAYESGIKEVESFQTVEHFWRIYNHLLRADKASVCDRLLHRLGRRTRPEDQDLPGVINCRRSYFWPEMACSCHASKPPFLVTFSRRFVCCLLADAERDGCSLIPGRD